MFHGKDKHFLKHCVLPYSFWKLPQDLLLQLMVHKDTLQQLCLLANFMCNGYSSPTLCCRLHGGPPMTFSRSGSSRSQAQKRKTHQLSSFQSKPKSRASAQYHKSKTITFVKKAENIIMGSLRSTLKYIHKYHDSIVDTNCYLKTPLQSKC